MAFKMKGNPMKRNFGIGSPMKQDDSDLSIKKEGYIAPADSTYADRMKVYEKKKTSHSMNRAYFKNIMHHLLKPGEKWEDDPTREQYLNYKFPKEYRGRKPEKDDTYEYGRWGNWKRSK